MSALKVHAKFMVIASVFSVLVTCQSVMLGQLASTADAKPQPTEECRKAEQPPWVDEKPSTDPCPIYGSKSG